ncbi:MAG: ABC transporter ATP-binding protein [Helicobacteraceae bacterium]|jgi:putative ABC transport system ATP-binding protein|nr:ABC transporter ATP-binding protein [Helicobacteraceae bacterium]
MIEFRNVKRVYGRGEATAIALKGVDMKIEQGEFAAIMGHSGSGKSTSMNIIGCLDSPTGGEYLFGGVSIGGLSRDTKALLRREYLGFIFQGFNLLGRTTARENVELPLIYRGMKAKDRHKLALEALDQVGLLSFESHTPAELSGGQQQRVAIARAIVTKPLVLLADEPTGNLDSARSVEVMELLRSFNRDRGITIVMVTHEEDMASYAQRTIRFRDGEIESHR